MTSQKDALAAIVLAAGKGTRMKSQLPKVLHPLCGRPMLAHVIHTLEQAGISEKCVVVGGDVELLQSHLKDFKHLSFALQRDRLGTGEAVACAGFSFAGITPPSFASGEHLAGPQLNARHVLICAGDTPAMDPEVLKNFVESCLAKKTKLAVLGMEHPEPKGYGRLMTDAQQQLIGIVEEKDASEEQKRITLCNSGVIFAETGHLFRLLKSLTQNNAQKEYYLTDCFALSRAEGEPAAVWTTRDFASFDGINDRRQLAQLEERILARLRRSHMEAGVSFQMASSTYLENTVSIGQDTTIGSHCSLLGLTRIGRDCEIGSHVVLKDVIIPDGAEVPPGTVRLS